MRSTAVGIVVYGDYTKLLNRLDLAINSGFVIYVFDNSPELEIMRVFSRSRSRDQIKYFTSGKNVGLAYGISTICAHAYYDSFKALLFFDQDTVFDESTLSFINKYYVNHPEHSLDYSAIVFNAKGVHALRESVFIISSGSMFYLENLKRINWHNEKYFVDCVDYEFCLRSNVNGYKLGEYSATPGFDHQLEQPESMYRVFGRSRMLRKYSFMRVVDATSGYIKLLLGSLGSGSGKYFYATLKSMTGYYFWQILVRVLAPCKK